ncbi:hypothetical protein NBRC10512_001553 [Rhodotorula toruloides]|uniref:RHTO0S07e07514g1_1 n=2 Tax=Rhodotorula toruloides TaxID=5286 RepID=A0A061B830_RHOTO|nr:actin-binding protein [Rhodotorula toruloides NP11]EMS25260.1 actin-binding protein [Rhodotorula toruloides NP11]KAJ8295464.1 tRNA(Thr) (cytosine(32)-N(3))-methyltransferase [Rhodotorula toruloides]CDR43058.1 RHTO0S07e07514g1_1 [Rhodotorula toruloides]
MTDTRNTEKAMPAEHAVAAAPAPATALASPAPQPARRKQPQLLADQLVAEELIEGAPSRNGGRRLEEGRDPWTHNAWDQVEWGEEEERFAQSALEKQRNSPVPQHLQDKFNADPAAQWDVFYRHNKDNFFKDRAWLRTEFPELAECLKADAGPKRIVELGCGNGSTLFPLLAANENPKLDLHGYDYSKEAVSVVKNHPSFDPTHLTCEVWDLSSPAGPPPTVEPNSVDVLTMIFVFSALHPDEWARAVENAYRMLKPGGVLLFRDYGRNDLAQLRFKANRLMQDGLYVRGDNTRVYFFERDELVYLFGGVRQKAKEATAGAATPSDATPSSATPGDATSFGSTSTTGTTRTTDTERTDTTPRDSTYTSLPESDSTDAALEAATGLLTTTTLTEDASGAISTSTTSAALPSTSPTSSRTGESLTPYRFDLLQLGVDRRLLLNRKRQLKMFRVWMQGRWRKPFEATAEEAGAQV